METIDLQTLIKADLLKGTIKRAKVILSGKIERAVTIKGLRVTKGAKAKIEAAGGSVVE
jgi:large subunit ribosomal protein L15